MDVFKKIPNPLDLLVDKEKKKGKGKKPKNDWSGWGKSMVNSLIFAILFMIVGSNAIYLQSYVLKSEKEYGDIFPDDINKAPYRDKSNLEKLKELAIKKKQEAFMEAYRKAQKLKDKKNELGAKFQEKISGIGSGLNKSKNQAGGGKLKDALDNLLKTQEKIEKNKIKELVEFKYSNPYKLLRSSDKWVVGKMGKIAADGIANSFLYPRIAIKTLFNYLSKIFGSDISTFYLFTPLVIASFYITPIYGFLSTTLFSFTNAFTKGIVGVILACIPFYLLPAFGVAIAQPFILAATFLFLPFIMDYKKTIKIVKQDGIINGVFIFLGLICYNSFNYIQHEISIPISVVIGVAFLWHLKSSMFDQRYQD